MSSLWTPGGERPVPRPGEASAPSSEPSRPPGGEPTEAELQEQMAELRERLARTPAEVVVANHAYGLFELAALHLSLDPPQLEQARLAIDSLGYLVEGLGERLGEPAGELSTALAQLRMAFVQVRAARQADRQADRQAPGGASTRPGNGPDRT